ncbi:MAG: pilus assembly protein [Cellulomonadaceae bacterium]
MSLRRRAPRLEVAQRASSRWREDTGSAVVEFLGVAVVLIVPLVYLILILARVQAASFAADGAARDAARAYARAADAVQGASRAATAVDMAFVDQGFAPGEARLEVVCSAAQCLVPGSSVEARVAIEVTFPGVPVGLSDGLSLHVPVTAAHTVVVDPLRAAP